MQELSARDVSLIPFFAPRFSGDELDRIKLVLASGYINEGIVTRAFERAIAAWVGRKYAIAVPSGTTALALSLMAAGIEPGDQVVVPDYTFIATANAARLAGGDVVFADVDRRNLCLTVESLRAAITPHVRFVMPVEVNGRRPDPAIYDLCRDSGLIVVTDSCEALGSADCGSHGIASCFSFSPNKLVTTGQGGMIVTDDSALCERLHELKFQGKSDRGTGGREVHPTLGFNFKFNDVLAAIGLAQLDALPQRLARCRKRDHWYRQQLTGVIEFLQTADDETCLWTDILSDHVDDMVLALQSHGIERRQFWLPLHTQQPYQRDCEPAFPVTEYVSARGVCLPSSHDITEWQVTQISKIIKRCLDHDV